VEQEEAHYGPKRSGSTLRTPTTTVSLNALCHEVEKDVSALNKNSKFHVQRLVNAAKQAVAEQPLLRDDINTSRRQNDEKKKRQSTKRLKPGKGMVMTYKELVKAREQRNKTEVAKAQRAARKRTKLGTAAS
jgi:hypothetical protein